MLHGTTPEPDPESQKDAAQIQEDQLSSSDFEDVRIRAVLAAAISELIGQQPKGGFKTVEVVVESTRNVEAVSHAAAATAGAAALRVKITVATKEEEQRKARKESLDKMRGWIMTILALLASMAMQAAFHPPQWFPTKGLDGHGHRASGPDVETPRRTFFYFLFTIGAFMYTTAAIPVMLSSSRLAVGRELRVVKTAVLGSVFFVGVVFALGTTSRTSISITICAGQIVLGLFLPVGGGIRQIRRAMKRRNRIQKKSAREPQYKRDESVAS